LEVDNFVEERVSWRREDGNRFTVIVAGQGKSPDGAAVFCILIFSVEWVKVSSDEFFNAFTEQAGAAAAIFDEFFIAEAKVFCTPEFGIEITAFDQGEGGVGLASAKEHSDNGLEERFAAVLWTDKGESLTWEMLVMKAEGTTGMLDPSTEGEELGIKVRVLAFSE
jgi:hypothetical protein